MYGGSFLRAFARVTRRVAAGAAVVGVLAAPPAADAAMALVRWLPPASSGVTGYAVYVRAPCATYSGAPVWTGTPAPAADGSMSATVTYTPSGTNYFSVVAVANGVESNISQERALGPTNSCREDACVAKTSCTCGNRPNGVPCDDASFCNGPEVCMAGVCDTSPTRDCTDAIDCSIDSCDEATRQCTHVGPPGCCLACDASDPCLADACAAGDCSAPEGLDIEISRVKFMKKAETIKLVGRGRFELDAAVDPSQTGALVEIRNAAGAALYAAAIDASLLHAGAASGRYRYTASRAEAAQQSNGLTRLDFRVKGPRWLVTLMADAPTLAEAAEDPEVTVMLRLGDNCLRHIDLPCTAKPHLSVCQ
ncbi:MAG: hypothetical protein IT293_12560 [Deltaproteobacteria bacterium]|nr:hypothetical protein [Deltaproteobacteria bacterium]